MNKARLDALSNALMAYLIKLHNLSWQDKFIYTPSLDFAELTDILRVVNAMATLEGLYSSESNFNPALLIAQPTVVESLESLV